MEEISPEEKEINKRFLKAYEKLKAQRKVEGKVKFMESMDLPREYFSRINKLEIPIPEKAITGLSNTYHVSRNWLLNNQGEMFDNLFEDKATPYSEQKSIILPFVPVPARASFVEMSGDQGSYGSFGTQAVAVSPSLIEGKRAFVIEIDGDSMEPQLKHGAKVVAVRVPGRLKEKIDKYWILISVSEQ